MKKLSIILSCILGLATLFGGCEKEKLPGSVYGVVTDKATGDPIINAGVELQPVGLKTVTGSDGRFEFNEIEAGTYNVFISKTGYTSFKSDDIEVKEGKQTQYDVQMEKLPASLRVVDDSNNDIDSLDFGNQTSDVARSFNIFNDGPESIEWEITKTANWISGLSKESGTLASGATQAVIVTIDRSLLQSGENTTTLHITSNNGSKQLTVLAVNGTVLPTLNTLNVTNIHSTSATLNGKILTAGTPSYTERGFVYSTSSTPTVENAIAQLTSPVTTSPDFSATATGLTTGATYYVRAYAINEAGTAYSTNVVNFQPQMSLPTVTTQNVTNVDVGAGSVTMNGNITNAGDPAYTERGFVFGTIHNPTLESDSSKVVPGVGTGSYSTNLTGLTLNTTYYIRAYATNAMGTAYGNEITVAFSGDLAMVSTENPTNVNLGAGTATLNGTIQSVGNPAYTERGFVYGVNHNPTVENDAKSISAGSGTGAFSSNVSGLAINTVYYVRAYATNLQGTAYGNEITINLTGTLPSVNTGDVSSINLGAGTAIFNGTIVNAGDPAYTERGFVYGVNHNPTVENDAKSISAGSGTGAYSSNITGLTLNTIYYIRAYSTSAMGTAYGSEVVLNFVGVIPTVSTSAATNIHIGAGTATFNGTIVNAGDPAYTERGFVYGIMHNPTIDDTKRTVSGNGTGAYYANVTNLVAGTTYYIRAYATNQQGTAYGEEVTMAFNPVMPELTTSTATNLSIGNQTATFNGTIVSVGDPAYTERGFVYGYMHNPTIEDDSKKVSPGNGAGVFSVNATGLEVGRTYYIRAYATSAFGTSYGNEVALDFSAILPTVTTLAVSDNVNGGATFNGNITNVGDPAYTERGFVYGTMSSPTIDDATVSVVSGTALGTYTKTVSNLYNGATYYVRAYAKNASNQVAYGTVVSFVVRPVYLLEGGGPGGIDLYVSLSDEGSFAWSTRNNTTGATNPSDGSANMEVIRAIDPDLSDYPAFKACSDMGSGWYLPSKDELNRLYSNKAAIGGFSDGNYWSSTEGDSDYAWTQHFGNGNQHDNSKSYAYRVRCVRRVN